MIHIFIKIIKYSMKYLMDVINWEEYFKDNFIRFNHFILLIPIK